MRREIDPQRIPQTDAGQRVAPFGRDLDLARHSKQAFSALALCKAEPQPCNLNLLLSHGKHTPLAVAHFL